MVTVNRLIRDSRESAEEAARLQGQISGLKQVIDSKTGEIQFLEEGVIQGQQTQAELTQAVQTNVLRTLRNQNILQQNLLIDLDEKRSTKTGLLLAAAGVAALLFLK